LNCGEEEKVLFELSFDEDDSIGGEGDLNGEGYLASDCKGEIENG